MQITIDLESLTPADGSLANWDDVKSYWLGGTGDTWKEDGLTAETIVLDIQHIVRQLADAEEKKDNE